MGELRCPCHHEARAQRSDRAGNRGGYDRNAGPGADADAHRDCDLTQRKAARRQRHDPAGEREHSDDPATGAFKEAGELGESGVESRVGSRHRGISAEHAGGRERRNRNSKRAAAILQIESGH